MASTQLDFDRHLKPLVWAGIPSGGVMFGIGMAVLGYFPGTGVTACGEGRKEAYSGVLGMLVGAAIFVTFDPSLFTLAGSPGDGGKQTLPELTGTSPWLWIAGITAMAGTAWALNRPSQRPSDAPGRTNA